MALFSTPFLASLLNRDERPGFDHPNNVAALTMTLRSTAAFSTSLQLRDERPGFEDDVLPRRVLGHQDLATGGPAVGMHWVAGTGKCVFLFL